jgi:hypothetical protein
MHNNNVIYRSAWGWVSVDAAQTHKDAQKEGRADDADETEEHHCSAASVGRWCEGAVCAHRCGEHRCGENRLVEHRCVARVA